jgi:hypothetical protein
MLSPDDRDAIEGLFRRLEEAERRGGPRDREAEDLIDRLARRQPAAPYYLAQTVVVQHEALVSAERRIAELESRLRAREEPPRRNPWGDPAPAPYAQGEPRSLGGSAGGGFLAGAAQTALGVAGGVLLGQMIGSAFSVGSAHAGEGQPGSDSPGDADTSADAGDAGSDTGGFDGGGFDGGFDTGGGF